MRAAGGSCLHPLLSCLCWRDTSNGIQGCPGPQEHPNPAAGAATPCLCCRHQTGIRDIRAPPTSSLGGLWWGQSCSGAGEHWQRACPHLWDILRVPVQPPPNLSVFLQQGERPQTCLRVGVVDQGEEHPKMGSCVRAKQGNLK